MQRQKQRVVQALALHSWHGTATAVVGTGKHWQLLYIEHQPLLHSYKPAFSSLYNQMQYISNAADALFGVLTPIEQICVRSIRTRR